MSEQLILPCLKDPAWAGTGTSVCRPLWDGTKSLYMPVVGFGYDHPHTFQFLTEAELATSGKNAATVEREAIRNLRLRTATWQPLDVKLGWFNKLQMLVCGDDFLAAERILDTGFMMEAQRRLKARGLLVGVPRRGFLVAMNGDEDAKKVQAFTAVLVSQFQSGESAPITPIALAVKDGKIVATLEIVAEALVPPHTMAPAPGGAEADDFDDEADTDADADPQAPYVTVMVVKNDAGLDDIMILAGGDYADSLARGVVNALAGSLTKYSGTPEFSGEIKVVILAMTPQPVRDELASLEKHLKGILSDFGGQLSGRELRLSVTQQPGTSPFGG